MKRVFLSLLALTLAQVAFAETVKKPEIDKLAIAEQAKVSPSFPAFLAEATKAYPKLKASVAAYEKMTPLAGDDLINIGRLLGLYNRLHNQKAVISAIEAMVALPTVRSDSIPPFESKPMIEFGRLVEAHGQGLRACNTATWTTGSLKSRLPGKGKEEFGILTHADVVPVTPDEWVLENGTRLDPFKLTRVGGYLYGRGTIDDKGSVAAVLYAMKAVKESGLPARAHHPPDDRDHRRNRR